MAVDCAAVTPALRTAGSGSVRVRFGNVPVKASGTPAPFATLTRAQPVNCGTVVTLSLI